MKAPWRLRLKWARPLYERALAIFMKVCSGRAHPDDAL